MYQHKLKPKSQCKYPREMIISQQALHYKPPIEEKHKSPQEMPESQQQYQQKPQIIWQCQQKLQNQKPHNVWQQHHHKPQNHQQQYHQKQQSQWKQHAKLKEFEVILDKSQSKKQLFESYQEIYSCIKEKTPQLAHLNATYKPKQPSSYSVQHRYEQCSISLPSDTKRLFSNFENCGFARLLIPGRIECNCAANRHSFVSSCAACGRIQCAQEGAGPCLYCSAPPGLAPPISNGRGRGLRQFVGASPRLIFSSPCPPSPSACPTNSSASTSVTCSTKELRRLSLRLQDGHLLRLRDDGLCLQAWEPWASMLLLPADKMPTVASFSLASTCSTGHLGELPSRVWPTHRGCLWIAVPSDRNQASLPPRPSKSAEPSQPLLILGCVQLEDVLSLDEHKRQCFDQSASNNTADATADSSIQSVKGMKDSSSIRLSPDARLHGGWCVLICSNPRRLIERSILTASLSSRGSVGLFQLQNKVHLLAQSLLSSSF